MDKIIKLTQDGQNKVFFLGLTTKGIYSVFIFLLSFGTIISFTTSTIVSAGKVKRPNCSSFGSRADAQLAYNVDKKTGINNLSKLDSDKDGIVCETTQY